MFDAGLNDWLASSAARRRRSMPASARRSQAPVPLDASDFNVASIAIGDLAGVQTVTRRSPTSSGMPRRTRPAHRADGLHVDLPPTSLTLAPGETQQLTITFTRTTATLNAYTGGQLTLYRRRHVVRSPVVVRPVALAAPVEVTGNGGPISYDVTFGYTGSFSATPRGLVPAVLTPGTVSDDPTDGTCSLTRRTRVIHDVLSLPGHVRALLAVRRGRHRRHRHRPVRVQRNRARRRERSAAPPPRRSTSLNPAAGDPHGRRPRLGRRRLVPVRAPHLAARRHDAGNMTVDAPAAAYRTDRHDRPEFSGLTAGTKYLGSVAYGGAAGMPNPTIVRVDTP